MPSNSRKSSSSEATNRLLKDMLVIQLALAGVGQADIRSIVAADMGRVNRIVKLVRPRAKRPARALHADHH